MMSLINGLQALGTRLTSLADMGIKDEERKLIRPLLSRGEAAVENKSEVVKTEPLRAGPRMPSGPNPYGDNPHAQALWLAERAIVGPESGGKADAQNKVSSAGGLFQVIDSTWDATMREMGLPVASSIEDRNAQKYMPDLNTRVMRQINTEAAGALDAAGLPVTVQTLQAAHRLGPAGATAALKTAMRDRDAPLVGNGLARDAVRGNGDIARLTVGQFLASPYPGSRKRDDI